MTKTMKVTIPKFSYTNVAKIPNISNGCRCDFCRVAYYDVPHGLYKTRNFIACRKCILRREESDPQWGLGVEAMTS